MIALIVEIVLGLLSLTAMIVVAVITGKLAHLCKHDKEQYLAILRLTVMSPDMPMSERLIAGDKYVKEGGNGDVKKYYDQLKRDHIK